MVRSTSLSPGAEMITFLAPACRCAPALALLVNSPVHSSTTSMPSCFHGSFAGSRPDTTRMRSSLTTMLSPRSEEHTSELQSRLHLVCRLLLEKKKNKNADVYDLRRML